MDVPEPLQQALSDSITSGKFIDTKLWAFSSRNKTTGRVGTPQPLYVNGSVLRPLPHFQHGEDDVADIRDGFPDLLEPFSDNYDYSSDSDFEVDEEEAKLDKVGGPPTVSKETQVGDVVSTALDSEKYGYILRFEKEDAQSETSGIMSGSEMESALTEFEDVNHGMSDFRRLAKTVVISDVAFVTLRAAVRYLYTNEIEFAPAERSKSRSDPIENNSEPYQALLPSPKSVYRLAAKYDIPALRMIALDEIKRTLESYDIIEEVFSKYTSRFPEIREVQVEHLARNLLSSIEPWKTAALKRKIEIYTSGALPHAQDILPTLYHRLANPRLLSMRTSHPFPTPPRGDFDWKVLKNELTKSLSSGTFLNMELHARESRSSDGQLKLVRPLYFCRAAGGQYTAKILSYVKNIPSGQNEVLDNAYKFDSDVEIEDDEISEHIEATNRNKRVKARSPRESSASSSGVLSVGAWKTWGAILYYLYTGKIAFGRLSSQPPEEGAFSKVGNQQAGGFQLPPASPKSVYTLACTIGLLPLRGLAFEDFKSKIDSTNITQELLSPFSARHTTIRTMLLRSFENGLKSSSNEELFTASIRTSSDGHAPHRGPAIGLVFERLIEEGRKVLYPPVKPKPPSIFESVTLTASNTLTTMTKSPPNTGSSYGGGSETTKRSLFSEGSASKFKKSGRKKQKFVERPHSPPCRCDICKRAASSIASKKSLSSLLS